MFLWYHKTFDTRMKRIISLDECYFLNIEFTNEGLMDIVQRVVTENYK